METKPSKKIDVQTNNKNLIGSLTDIKESTAKLKSELEAFGVPFNDDAINILLKEQEMQACELIDQSEFKVNWMDISRVMLGSDNIAKLANEIDSYIGLTSVPNVMSVSYNEETRKHRKNIILKLKEIFTIYYLEELRGIVYSKYLQNKVEVKEKNIIDANIDGMFQTPYYNCF
jgi:hypothetical protein